MLAGPGLWLNALAIALAFTPECADVRLEPRRREVAVAASGHDSWRADLGDHNNRAERRRQARLLRKPR